MNLPIFIPIFTGFEVPALYITKKRITVFLYEKINNTKITFNQTFLNVDNGVSGLSASSMTLASVNTLNNFEFEVYIIERAENMRVIACCHN